ncbi:hypothetical protein QJS04_geneDACA005929 [Acorus gramineus]|uniref:F-box domain-containing protein n=1 Tax=Acorus gramineus TaxID=55184 RepID=A0AAV9B561_ACOGR|nr:hypothetical protein QJS04_geneDACA005929 [Acorus gramineus]
MKKKQRPSETLTSPLETLPTSTLFEILDRLPLSDLKSVSLTSKTLLSVESSHRRTLRPLRPDLLPVALRRYPSASRLDLSLCPRVTDASLSSLPVSPSLAAVVLSPRSVGISRYGVAGLVDRCRNLVEIDLSDAAGVDDAAVAVIGRGCANLEALRLSRCVGVTDIGVAWVAVGCRRLKRLCLRWCVKVTDLGVGLVAAKCEEIRSLDLSYVQITEKCLPAVLRLRKLENLALVGCVGIDDEGLMALKQGCKSLETLDLSYCENVTHAGLSYLTNGCDRLCQLNLSYGSLVNNSLGNCLGKLSNLQSIRLDGSHVTCPGLMAIGTCGISLKELSLSKCSGVRDEGLCFLVEKHKDLVKLDITCCRSITYLSIASITTSCTSLTSLRMESCSLVSKEAFILIGQRCRFLEELDVTDNELDNEGLKAISRCLELTSLKIGICLNITDEGLIDVGTHCHKLQELDLYRCASITDSGVSAVANGCSRLQMINLAYCKEITDCSLRTLSECSDLSTLEIRGCVLVSSIGLSAIAVGCKLITKLDVKNCQDVDDVGMLSLARMSKNLRQINISYCSVTDVGLLALSSISCLQNMTILHISGVTPNGLAAALLACGGLTKVKLHSSFRSLFPRSFIDHIQARGCELHWRDKPFKFEEDPKIWRLHSRAEIRAV